MSDQSLRELERRWKETGAVEDEAAYLLERVRVGALAQERLELAAYCGAAAASHATPIKSPSQARDFMRGLSRFGGESIVRALHVAAGELSRQWEAEFTGDSTLSDTLATVESWLGGQRQPGLASGLTDPLESRHAGSQDSFESAALWVMRDLLQRASELVAPNNGDAWEELFIYWELFEDLERGWSAGARAAVAEALTRWALG